MRKNPRGLAFIINNKNFKPYLGVGTRSGTDVDAEALKDLFQSLWFETEVFRNQNTEQIFKVVIDYASRDYSRYDCFMCAILTHGEEGLIYSTDSKILINDLISKFRAGNLTGKPKIFFFQACQGSRSEIRKYACVVVRRDDKRDKDRTHAVKRKTKGQDTVILIHFIFNCKIS